MTTLKHRKLSFELDENTPFYWNPKNPQWSRQANAVSFSIVAFERYLVRTMNAAIPHINNPAIQAEARALLEQEARHSAAHQRHVKIICQQYPGLNETLPKMNACYDKLFDAKSLQCNLAMIANIELMFTPLAKQMIDNRERFFLEGDPTISSLFLWHCMEEMEHRNSAVSVYNELYSNLLHTHSWYRLFQWRSLQKHMQATTGVLMADFTKHVPAHETETEEKHATKKSTFSISRKLRSLGRFSKVLVTQLPFYNPNNERLPEFALEWFEREAAGEDMTHYYGKGIPT